MKWRDKYTKSIDALIPLIVFAGPLMTVPQAYKIWESHDVSGVSLISWVAYVVLSFVWILYALAHKERTVLMHNVLYFLVCSLVVIGIIVFA